MTFKVQLIKGNKVVTNKTVKMYEPGWFGEAHEMHHTGNGWYECNSNASQGKIFVSNDFLGSTEYGPHPNLDTVCIHNWLFLLIFNRVANWFGYFYFGKIF